MVRWLLLLFVTILASQPLNSSFALATNRAFQRSTEVADGVDFQFVQGDAGTLPNGAAMLSLDRVSLAPGDRVELPPANVSSAWIAETGSIDLNGVSLSNGDGVVTRGDVDTIVENSGSGDATVLRFGITPDGQPLSPQVGFENVIASLIAVTFPAVPATPADLVLGLLNFEPSAVLPENTSPGPMILIPASGPITLTTPKEYAGPFQPGEAFASSSTLSKSFKNDDEERAVTVVVAGIVPQDAAPFIFADTSLANNPEPTTEPTPEPTPTTAVTPAANRPLKDRIPGAADVPSGLSIIFDQARDINDMISVAADPASMPQRLKDWGWIENYTRRFATADAEFSTSAGITYLEFSAHRFQTDNGAASALAFYIDERATAGQLGEITIPQYGDKSRAISGRALVGNMPAGSTECSIYIQFGKDLLRVTAVSPTGDAPAQLLDLLPKFVDLYLSDGSGSGTGRGSATTTNATSEEIVASEGAPKVISSDLGIEEFIATLSYGDGLLFLNPSPHCCGIPGNPLMLVVDPETGSLAWQVPGQVTLPVGAAYARGAIYLIHNGQVIALDSDDGRDLWTYTFNEVGYSYGCSPIYSDGKLFVASGASVVALNATTGEQLWTWLPDFGVTCELTVVDDLLFAGLSSDSDGPSGLVALDAGTGNQRWIYSAAVDTSVAVAGRPEGVYLTQGTAGLFAFDLNTGAQLWQAFPDGIQESSPSIVATKSSVYVSLPGGVVGSASSADGHERWRHSTGDERIQSIGLWESRPLVASESGSFGISTNNGESTVNYGSSTLSSLSTKDGSENWNIAFSSVFYADALALKDRIVVATVKGVILLGSA